MKFYSSMTLADFVAANWMEMDPQVVRMMERESELLIEAEDAASAWEENYHDTLRAAELFKRDIEEIVNDYTHMRISLDDFVTSLRSACNDVVFDL